MFTLNILIGQTAEQIKKAKDFIEQSGMSEAQVRDAAKSRGYTDKQIDNAIKKKKAQKLNLKTLYLNLPKRLISRCWNIQ